MPSQITKLNLNGINTDISVYELPETTWTNGNNIVFDNDLTKKATGTADVFGSTSIAPYWLLPFQSASLWLYAGAAAIYKLSGSTHTAITRASGGYTATQGDWNGGVLGGVAVLNNGTDAPQQFGSAAAACTDLSNWTADSRAKVIRPFKEFLVALNVTENFGTASVAEYPYRVMWSNPADAGSVPTSWDYSDATKDTGYVDLSETDGVIIDCLPLKDYNFIYKEDSVYNMSHVGGAFIFSFSQVFSESGILSRDCVQSFDDKHFVVGVNDIYIHNGQTKQSVADRVIKDEIFSAINSTHYKNTFVTANHKDSEMWVCIPSQASSGECDLAYVWNYSTNMWSKRDLPSASFIAPGIVNDSSSYTQDWDSDTNSWDSDDTDWNFTGFNPTQTALLIASTNSKLRKVDTFQNSGSDYLSWVEKTGMSLGTTLNKSIQKIVPHIEGNGSVDFYVGTESVPNAGVSWKGPYSITPGTHSDIPVRANGKYVSVKLQSQDSNHWSLTNLELHWKPSGNRGTGV